MSSPTKVQPRNVPPQTISPETVVEPLSIVELRSLLDRLRGEERFARVFFKTSDGERHPIMGISLEKNEDLSHSILVIMEKES